MSAVLSRLHEAAVVTSEEGRVTEINDAFCRLAGFRRDELIGRMIPLLDGIPCSSSADAPDVAAVPSWIASVVVVCADGSHLSVLAALSRISLGNGAHAYLVCVQLAAVAVGRLLGNRKPSLGRRHDSRRPRPATPRIRGSITSELELAAEKGEFFSRYQPIVSLADGRIEAFESLLRWQHPTHGVIGPGAFIGEAESRGILAAITHEILLDACTDAAHWNEIRTGSQPISVSVNLCGSQLRDPHLMFSIESALVASGLRPSLLWLEITENTGVTEAARDPSLMHGLRSLGVQLVLDDFGTGYASLGSVRKLPLDIIKFDRSLVSGAADNRCDARILAAGIEIAQALEIEVIAEGIEQRSQIEYLLSIECGSGQGYYFSRPIDRDRADLLVTTAPTFSEEIRSAA